VGADEHCWGHAFSDFMHREHAGRRRKPCKADWFRGSRSLRPGRVGCQQHNTAGDFPAHRDLLIKHGIFAQLRGVITRVDTIGMPLTLRLNVTLTILNLCRGKPAPPLAAIEVAVPIVVEMVKCPDTEVARDALWTLMHISDRNNDGISVMIANGALPVIMHHLSSHAAKILRGACAAMPRQHRRW
jgi:hypothetical protein